MISPHQIWVPKREIIRPPGVPNEPLFPGRERIRPYSALSGLNMQRQPLKPMAAANFWEDTFTDTAGTNITSHTGEAGATYTVYGAWSSGDGMIVITDANRSRYGTLDSVNGEWGVLASGTPAGAEYDIAFTMRRKTNSSSSIGLMARATYPLSVARYYRIQYRASTNVWTLTKVAGGTTTDLGTYTSAYGADADITGVFEIRNAAKKLFLEGVERISSTDNVITEAGQCGVYTGIYGTSANTTGVHLDSVVATNV